MPLYYIHSLRQPNPEASSSMGCGGAEMFTAASNGIAEAARVLLGESPKPHIGIFKTALGIWLA